MRFSPHAYLLQHEIIVFQLVQTCRQPFYDQLIRLSFVLVQLSHIKFVIESILALSTSNMFHNIRMFSVLLNQSTCIHLEL